MGRKQFLEDAAEEYLLGIKKPGKCEYCKQEVEYIVETPSYTYFHWDPCLDKENPNNDKMLCIICAESHVDYWSEQWAEYYSSIL
jgi:hypothetical protein